MALGNIGPEAKAAVPALIKALKDEDANVRRTTAWALVKIAPEALEGEEQEVAPSGSHTKQTNER